MITRSFTAFGCLVALGVGSMAVGCSGGADGGEAEKVAASSAALIVANPKGPDSFPDNTVDGYKNPYSCTGKMQATGGSSLLASIEKDPTKGNYENYLALPTAGSTDNNGVYDSYTTTYTHGYTFNGTSCASGDLSCQLQSDFFGIPSAHGFKYLVKKIDSITCTMMPPNPRPVCTANVSNTAFWYVAGVQRVDESWWWKPWNFQSGIAAPWTLLSNDTTSGIYAHPPYGADYRSADWKSLWDLAFTYSYGQGGPNDKFTAKIAAEHHQCAAIFGTDGSGGLTNIDFFTGMAEWDPLGPYW